MKNNEDGCKNSATREMEKNEYFNAEDGLIYCKNCHTPRQARYVLPDGNVYMPDIQCQCQKEQFKKQQEEKKQEGLRQNVERLKNEGFSDAKLYEYNFSNDNGINPEMRYAHIYVDNWSKMYESGNGLLLWGNVGTGKSFFAGCIANALMEQGVSVLMTNFARILNELTDGYSEKRKRYLQELNHYKLLIIDDLGIERNSEFSQEQIFNVIDSRYLSKKPMIVTTNLTLDELKHPNDIKRARIYDRILEMCVPIRINNQNFREGKAAANLQEARQLFS